MNRRIKYGWMLLLQLQNESLLVNTPFAVDDDVRSTNRTTEQNTIQRSVRRRNSDPNCLSFIGYDKSKLTKIQRKMKMKRNRMRKTNVAIAIE
jgi:hypothetical protein